ncbi:MAG: pyridoxal-phosphate dependent enzyme [Elusimicrobia bacterium]|nr:pyridoxal-phosphate dependent enzyme [Elusimicrobiota bacterium]
MQKIEKILAKFKKVSLGIYPTPLYKLKKITKYLGGPSIYIKRDDLNGLGLGGNKCRKLQYLMAEAVRIGATDILTAGGIQSNHANQTALAASRLGMTSHLFLGGSKPKKYEGNLILNQIVGANMYFCGTNDWDEIIKIMKDFEKKLIYKNKKPFSFPVGGSVPVAVLGYIEAFKEIVEQLPSLTAIFHTSSSGGTQSGFLIGSQIVDIPVSIYGMAVAKGMLPGLEGYIRKLITETQKMLNIEQKKLRIILDNKIMGPGYGIESSAGREASKLLAKLEGIYLDPFYTAKGFAGMLKHVKSEKFKKKDNIVFIHTGGYGAIFAS